MKLQFDIKKFKRMIGIRLTDDEYKKIKKIATENNQTMSMTCRVIVLAALKELEPKRK